MLVFSQISPKMGEGTIFRLSAGPSVGLLVGPSSFPIRAGSYTSNAPIRALVLRDKRLLGDRTSVAIHKEKSFKILPVN